MKYFLKNVVLLTAVTVLISAVVWSQSKSSAPTVLTNSTGIKLLRIEPGTFEMGEINPTPDSLRGPRYTPQGDWDESPVHKVTITKAFYISETPITIEQYRQFKKEYQGFQDEAQKLKQQFDSAVQTFEKQSIALSSSAKAAKQKELQQLQQRLEQRSSELQDKSQQRQRELIQPIQARVNAVIQGLRAEGNYALIFDADSPTSNIVAADPSLDITPKVIERLKQAK